MPEPKFPLLVLPQAIAVDKRPRGGRGSPVQFPSRQRQIDRLTPKFQRLQDVFERRRAELVAAVDGVPVEQVIVFQTAGSIENFNKAVVKAGFEWLFDVDGESASPDNDFRVAKEANVAVPTKPVESKLYLILSDQQAIEQTLSLWEQWQQGREFKRGLTPWVHVFEQLREVRLWDLSDRIGDDTQTYWQDRLDAGEQLIRTEIELWYAASPQKNLEWSQGLRTLLQESNSAVVAQADIPDIRYRAFLVDLSRNAVASLLAGDASPLSAAGQIMYYRPQVRGMVVGNGVETEAKTIQRPIPTGDPVVAILDGVPLQNHQLLGNRIILDDPRGFQAQSAPADRIHGSGMASVVLHGDLSASSKTIASRILVHPILIPDLNSLQIPREERTPPDRLLADLIHVAVKRIVQGEGQAPPIAANLRVINLCIGDLNREFVRSLSPLARLLDWLSWKYRVLFVVPTGNVSIRDLELDVARNAFDALNPAQRSAAILRAISADTQNRMLLSPAESINALTVGGTYSDGSTFTAAADRFLAFTEAWASPNGRLGPGHLRSVKPEIVAPSGRRLFGQRLGNTHPNSAVSAFNVGTPPGILAAAPATGSPDLGHCRYSSGTSNSAALTSHAAAHAHAAIQELRGLVGDPNLLPTQYDAVLLKALVVHTCQWPQSDSLEAALDNSSVDANERKRRMSRLFGYGCLDIDRARGCTDERATLIAAGEISVDEGYRYRVPLPQSLSGKLEWRRLSITLAWFSPINMAHRDYRRALLWFSASHESLRVEAAGADWQAARRGTVQHEVWSGNRASAFAQNDELEIVVSCAADAGELTDSIPFALCVSVEVREGVQIPVYVEVAEKIAARVPIQPL